MQHSLGQNSISPASSCVALVSSPSPEPRQHFSVRGLGFVVSGLGLAVLESGVLGRGGHVAVAPDEAGHEGLQTPRGGTNPMRAGTGRLRPWNTRSLQVRWFGFGLFGWVV